jgi:uncharacterized membrane protein (DUF2068 family)
VTRHVTFLIRLTQLWSGFNLVVGLALTAFSVAAAMLVVSAREQPPGTEVAAGVTAATLAVVALAAIVWAVAHHVAGRGLRTRKAWARHLALVLAAFDLLLLPLGTALGVYTLWVLLHEQVRLEFQPVAQSP